MKNKLWILIFIFVSLAFSSCSTEGRFQLTVITEGEQHLTGTTFGDLIMLGGNTTIEPDAVLEGSAHLLSGQLDLQGKVTGSRPSRQCPGHSSVLVDKRHFDWPGRGIG